MANNGKVNTTIFIVALAAILMIFPVNVILFVTSCYSLIWFLVVAAIMITLLVVWTLLFNKRKK